MLRIFDIGTSSPGKGVGVGFAGEATPGAEAGPPLLAGFSK
jgi:hypothetical protein